VSHDGPVVSPGVVLFVNSDHVDGDYRVHVEALRAAGYRVEMSPTALDALQRGRALRPDVVIVPLLMPDMSGSDLAQRMGKGISAGRTLAVVILAPDGAGREPDGPVAAGATLCTIPCAPGDLVTMVGRQLAARPPAQD